MVRDMRDIRDALEENYLAFIATAMAAVVFIAGAIWVVTVFYRKVKR